VPSESRGTVATGTSTATPITVTSVPPPGPQSYVLVAVVLSNNSISVTGITGGTGTFVLAATISSAGGRRLELWVGYNFGSSAPTSIVVSRGAGTFNAAVVARTIDILADTTVAPTFTASTGNTATSTAPDTGLLTPAVGDILFAAHIEGTGVPGSTARIHTGNSYLQNTGAVLTNVRVETGWCEAVAAVASKEVWTVTSVEWAAIQAKWTPPASPTPTSALLLKGLTTQAADAASSY
jgi:hypothetical protein